MAKNETVKLLGGFSYTYNNVPESADEFDTAAGREGACLRSAVDNTKYRSGNAEARTKIIESLEELTDIKRKTRTTGEGEDAEVVFDESEATFIKRVVAETGKSPEELQAEIGEVSVDFDVTERERSSSPRAGKPGKTMLAAAQKIVDAGNAEDAAIKASAKLGRKVEPTVESLASALQAINKLLQAEATARLEAELGVGA